MFHIRPLRPEDVSQLADLYEKTVRRWAPNHYSPEQVEAWATVAHDGDRFHGMLHNGQTFVATDSSETPLGFSGIEDDGRIASLYVAAESTRLGIGTRLLQHGIALAQEKKLPEVWSQASFLSRPLFEKNGFRVTQSEEVVIHDVTFERWIVSKTLGKHS